MKYSVLKLGFLSVTVILLFKITEKQTLRISRQIKHGSSEAIIITAEGSKKMQSNYPDNLSLLDCCAKNKTEELQGKFVVHGNARASP